MSDFYARSILAPYCSNPMMTLELARDIAQRRLSDLAKESGVQLEIISHREQPHGWLFFYNSTDYARMGDMLDMLAGNSPFLVDGRDYLASHERSRAG